MANKNNFFWHFFSMLAYLVVVLFSLYIFLGSNKAVNTISVFDFIILSLAAFRLTHLLVYDSITDFIRHYFKNSKSDFYGSMDELLRCPWCTGVWTAFFVGFLYFFSPVFWYLIFLVALAGLGSIIQIITNLIIRLTPPR